ERACPGMPGCLADESAGARPDQSTGADAFFRVIQVLAADGEHAGQNGEAEQPALPTRTPTRRCEHDLPPLDLSGGSRPTLPWRLGEDTKKRHPAAGAARRPGGVTERENRVNRVSVSRPRCVAERRMA